MYRDPLQHIDQVGIRVDAVLAKRAEQTLDSPNQARHPPSSCKTTSLSLFRRLAIAAKCTLYSACSSDGQSSHMIDKSAFRAASKLTRVNATALTKRTNWLGNKLPARLSLHHPHSIFGTASSMPSNACLRRQVACFATAVSNCCNREIAGLNRIQLTYQFKRGMGAWWVI